MNKIKRCDEFYVYIVECADGTFYTGYTSDIKRRLREHNNGARGAKYLRGKTPAKLVYVKEYNYYKRVLRAERTIKKLSHRQKQELVQIYEKSK